MPETRDPLAYEFPVQEPPQPMNWQGTVETKRASWGEA